MSEEAKNRVMDAKALIKRDSASHQEDVQGELFPERLIKDMLDVERQRIDSMDKKTETARMWIKASDDADKRQFEYQMARLAGENAENERRHRLGRAVVLGGGMASICIITLLVGFMFFGSSEQSALAMECLKLLFVGIGGYGVIAGLLSLSKKLISG